VASVEFEKLFGKQPRYQSTTNSYLKILTVPFPWPDRATGPMAGSTLNPWHYVSSNPTNNPASYDLWAEFVDGKKLKTICNWAREVLEKP